MAQINFPVATSAGQQFEGDNGVIYTYVGTPPNGFWSGSFQATGLTTLDSRYLKLDSSNDPITAGLNITGGNVGIGTSSPGRTLHVSSSASNPVRVQSSSTVSRIEFRDSNTGANDSVSIGSDGNDFQINTNIGALGGTRRVTVKDSGNVGIGTNSPSSLLHISSTVDTALKVQAASAVPTIELLRGNNTGFGTDATYDYRLKNEAGKLTIQNGVSSTISDLLTIDNLGNVGIGNTDPDEILTVGNTTTNNIIRMRAGATSVNGLDFGDANDADVGRIRYSHSDNSLAFTTNAAERMRINSSGNVGIGTSSPDVKLHVSDSAISQSWSDNAADLVKIEGTVKGINFVNSTTGFIAFSDAVARSQGVIEYTHSSDSMQFRTSGSEKIRITSIGNVGIGTNDPQQKLDINGKYARIGDGTSTGIIQYGSNANPTNFHLGASNGVFRLWYGDIGSGTEILRISNAGGVSWNGGADFLDDYEEGTWTPSITGCTAYGSRIGYYTKIGRLVTFTVRVQPTAGTGSSAALEISGLPFNTASIAAGPYGGAFPSYGSLVDRSAVPNLNLHLPINNTVIRAYSNASPIASYNSNVTLTGNFIFNGSYYTA